ncbi:type II secretion system minor pseudopilin GspK [Aliidiomarina soli]|nr:type II secretion system minor pseudopilin GspK [Aliidiomarina soli]
MNHSGKQQGVALITVLLVVALVTVIAVGMSGRLQSQVTRAHSMEQAEQGYWHWLSAEELVRQLLHVELENDGYAHGGQSWAEEQGPYPVAGGLIGGTIRDLHSCFNLNALYPGAEGDGNDTASLALEQYQALLRALEFDDFTVEQLSATLLDWLDDDTVLINQYGAEDADYESMPQPYQAANGLMSHVSETRQIIGYTQEVYQRIRPYVCVIPQSSTLAFNINTMDETKAELLSAIFFGELSVDEASRLLASWPETGYEDVAEIMELAELQGIIPEGEEDLPAGDSLTVASEYFELRAAIRFGETEFFATSIVQARGGEVRILHRSRRGYDWDD